MKIALICALALLFVPSALSQQAGGIALRLVSEDATTITLGWDQVPGVRGYRFSRSDQDKSSWTWDGSRTTVRFGKGAAEYTVEALSVIDFGKYPPPPTPPPVSADYFVAPGGSDSNAGTQAAPFGSLDRAYRAAACGDTVNVAPGNYPDQTIRERTALASCTKPVWFKGAGASMARITEQGDWVRLDGFRWTWGIFLNGDVRHVTIENGDGGGLNIDGGPSDIVVRNNDLGPCAASGAGSCERIFVLDHSASLDTHDILFENNSIHDFTLTPGAHWECVFATGGSNVTFRGNHFWNCETYGLRLVEDCGHISGTPCKFVNWLVENNWFGRTCCFGTNERSSAVVVGGRTSAGVDVLIRFNSFAAGQTVTSEGGTNTPSTRLVGNILGTGPCLPVSYVYNLILGTTCGANDARITSMPYVNPSNGAGGDYHLSGPSLADGFVPASAPGSDLAFDKDGQPRVPPRDAGADEH